MAGSAPSRTRALTIGAAVAALATAAIVAFIPSEQQLGDAIRLVLFHGASTWVNLATFSATALASLLFLVTRRAVLATWASALRWVSLPLWILNTTMGFLSMKIVWGGVLWREPRLQMTFWVLLGAVVIILVDLLAERPVVTSILDVVGIGALWAVLLSTPNLLHPDNPVFNSPEPILPMLFVGIVVTYGTMIGLLTIILRSLLRAGTSTSAVDTEAANA